MKRWKQICALLLAAACGLALLTGCGSGGAEETTALRVCLGGTQTSLDPARTETDDNATILLHLYENLLRLEADDNGGLTLGKGVASDYAATENYDGTVSYSFTISPSAKWSDGQAVTANDFVYAWQRLVDPATASPNASLLSMVKGYSDAVSSGDPTKLAVRASKDGMTLKVVLSYHCPFFLESVCAGAATMPVRSDVVEKYGENWGSLSQALITDGAYMLGEWDVESKLALVRNPYSESRRGADTLTFLFTADREEAYTLLLGGEADFVAPLSETQAEKQIAGGHPDAYAETQALLFNQSGQFANMAAREAFSLTLDYGTLSEAFGATDMPATGLIPYGIRESDGDDFRTVGGALIDTSAEGYESRCEEADAALQEAKLALTDVEFVYAAGEQAQQMAEALQTAWQERLQIRVTLTPLSTAALAERIASGNYDIASIALHADYPDGMAFLSRWESSEADEIAYGSSAYDMLISVIKGALDPLARDNYLHAAEETLLKEYVVAPLLFRGTTSDKTDVLQGVLYDGRGHYSFHDITFVQ